MTLQHVRWWNSHIQPVIDEDTTRADRYWNWILISATSNIAGRFFSRKPKGCTIGLEHNGYFIPCALIQLIGKFPYFIDQNKKVFLFGIFQWLLKKL